MNSTSCFDFTHPIYSGRSVQIFLELMPEIVKQETWGSGILVRPDFWRNRHQQAVEAIKTIPRILTSE